MTRGFVRAFAACGLLAACGGSQVAGSGGHTGARRSAEGQAPPKPVTMPAPPAAASAEHELLALVAAAHEGRATLSADRLLSAFTTREDLLSIGVEPSPPLRGRKAFEAAVRGGFASGLRSARRVATTNQVWAAPDGSVAGLTSELVEEGDADYRDADGKTGVVQYHLPLRLTAFARREDGKLKIVLWRLSAAIDTARLAPAIAAEIQAARPSPNLEDHGAGVNPPPESRALATLEALETGGTAESVAAQLGDEVTLMGPQPGAPHERDAWVRERASATLRGRAVNTIDAGSFGDAHAVWAYLDVVATEPAKPPLYLRVTAVLVGDATGRLRVRMLDEGVPVPAVTAVELLSR